MSHRIKPKLLYIPRLFLFLLPLAQSVRQPTANHINQAQTHCRTADNSPRAPFLHKRLLPATREQQVQPGPRRADTGCIGFEALDVGIAGEYKDGREKHGKGLEWSHVLCGDESGEQGGWE